MAVTHGHGNPGWTRDETILALDLYFDLNRIVPSEKHPRVKKLSDDLRSFPWHAEVTRKERFRNPAGVAFKIQNLRSLDTNKGLKHVSRMDRDVWSELGLHPKTVKDIAASIYEALKSGSVDLRNAYESDEDEFVEGKLLTETHKRRERNPGLRRKLIAIRNKQGPLICDVCGSKCHVGHPEYQEAPFEAHHLIPLSMAYSTATKLSDLALLCASCHRLVHRAIVLKKRWLTIAECKDIFGC